MADAIEYATDKANSLHFCYEINMQFYVITRPEWDRY